MRAIVVSVLCCLPWLVPAQSDAGILIHFDQDQYRVIEGESVAVSLILDADDQQAGDQLLPDGLFSMAYEVSYDGGFVEVVSDGQVMLPDGFDTDGISGGPPFTRLPGNATNPPSVRVFTALTNPFQDGFYFGTDRGQGVQMWLGTILLMATTPGTFDLNVEVFKRNATDEVFVQLLQDGSSNVLDDQIVAGSATVEVEIPEPTTLMIAMAGLGVCVGLRRGRTKHTLPLDRK